MATYTQIKIKSEYRHRLSLLAAAHSRSMANMVEVLIDQEYEKSKVKETV